MMVRPKKTQGRKGEVERVPAMPFTFPSPIRGWVLDENLATVQPGAASILDNWICTTTGIRVRGGSLKHATIGGAVKSIFRYVSGATEKMFAASASAIYDITSPATPTTIPATSVSALTGGDWSATQFGTAGGNFLVIANGTDSVRNYDGTTWTTPAITAVTSSTLSHVWSYGSKLFFVQKNTQSAWYLPVDQIAGAAVQVSLAGIFQKGGPLLFGAKWSMDAGDGLDDKCVFVSAEGEVAIYEGTNPADAANWRLAGLYQMPEPIGKKGYTQAGGDLLIANDVGLIPVSAAIQKDIGALDQSAVSRPISPYWQSQALSLSGSAWEIVKIPRSNIMVISQPSASANSCLVVNLQTGAWSRVTGWDTQCLGYFNNRGYYGASDSCIYLMEGAGSDNGLPYTSVYLGQHETMGHYGQQKTVLQMRAVLKSSGKVYPQITAQVDYVGEVLSPPSSAPNTINASGWDSGVWDTTLWDAGSNPPAIGTSLWASIGRTGYAVAPELQLTFAGTVAPLVELVAIDTQFRLGSVVT